MEILYAVLSACVIPSNGNDKNSSFKNLNGKNQLLIMAMVVSLPLREKSVPS